MFQLSGFLMRILLCILIFFAGLNANNLLAQCPVVLFGNVQTHVACRNGGTTIGVQNTNQSSNYTFYFNNGVTSERIGGPLVGTGGGLSVSEGITSAAGVGNYTIEARNGTNVCINGIYVYYGNIDNLSISAWGGGSVSFSWTSSGTGVEYEYIVSTQSNPALIPSYSSTTNTSAIVNGLTPGLTYFIHIRVFKVQGQAYPGTTIPFNCVPPWETIYFTAYTTASTLGSISASSPFICTGGSSVLTATGGSTYQWYKDGVIIPTATNQTYIVTQRGNYTVLITTLAGCTGMAYSQYISEKTTVQSVLKGGGNYCLGQQVTLKIRPTRASQFYQIRHNGVTVASLPGIGTANSSFPTSDDTLRYTFTLNTPSQAGTYSVYTTNGSCTGVSFGSENVGILTTTAPLTPTIQSLTVPNCPTPLLGSVTVSTSTPGTITYNLINSAGEIVATNTSGTFINTASGTYTITAFNGCS